MQRLLFFSLFTLLCVCCMSCDSNAPKKATSKEVFSDSSISIVCTTGMIADVVSEIVGPHARVSTLIGAGVDPHLYKATRTDIATLASANLVFANGLYLEGKLESALDRIKQSGVPVVLLGETVDETLLMKPEEFEGEYDPHIWMAPSLWQEIVPAVVRALIDVLPDLEEEFKSNARKYKTTLEALHVYAGVALRSIPEASRVLVTAHDAFGYFGRAYDIEVVGVQGLSTESEAGIRDVERIVSLLVTRHVQAVFVESTISEKNVEALREGAAAQNHAVSVGGTLYADAMGKRGTPEGTYPGMILHNIETITTALGGTLPPRPAILKVQE